MNPEHKYLLKMFAIALVLTGIVVGILEYVSRQPSAVSPQVPGEYIKVRTGVGR